MSLVFCLVLYISRVKPMVWSSIGEVRLATRGEAPDLVTNPGPYR
jgi:hypothetical protein